MKLGSVLVHPSHGPAKVVGTQIRKFAGVAQELVELMVVEGGMKLLVPADALADLGMREPMDADAAQEVLETLRAEPTPIMKGQWARQFKAFVEQSRSGEPMEQAAVVRDLLAKPSPSAGEQRLLTQTKRMLATELGGALGIESDEADALIIKTAARPVVED